ncbi:MAG: hypothetical protein NMK33_02220 [Candidatus Cardinium sp.]|uniref:hypothetical protein n=1 Tax=Cardinium endosymbiont of Dermatophagoides farinae TaxID=2597823 RepID=UPI0011837423|nr:hypothetical protein [Cardinium endosymbiont of Dermatophagoides farinae]TSJ81297.1 hypothetical protein FPG78_04895 [Cardinium endosymbiont of Dermatophagoides farinae]UWW97357.1 MAG: hypothetical protein NMK33_02220 [Candidatus Cardinium sp.]
MKKYRDARVALFIGLLSLNTLSSCVNTRQSLAMRRPSLGLKSDFIQGRLRRSYCRWAGVVTFFAVNLGIILVIIEMTPVGNTALLNSNSSIGNSSMVTTLGPDNATMRSASNENFGNGSGMFTDGLDLYTATSNATFNNLPVRSEWEKHLLSLKWVHDLLTSEWMKDLFRSNTNNSSNFIVP